MVAYVPIRGQDTTLAVDAGSRTITVSGSGTQGIANIDMRGDRHTRRTVLLQNSALVRRFISFEIQLYGWDWSRPAQFPQRHVIETVLRGANGPNGFVPAAVSMGHSVDEYVNEEAPPINLASTLQIRGGPYAGKDSSSIAYWHVSEDNLWAVSTKSTDVREFPPYSDTEIYTRPCDLAAIILGWPPSEDYAQHMRVWRALNLFYSPNNVCTLEFTLDMPAQDRNYLTIKKYMGGENLS